jgi:hypothetical protein
MLVYICARACVYLCLDYQRTKSLTSTGARPQQTRCVSALHPAHPRTTAADPIKITQRGASRCCRAKQPNKPHSNKPQMMPTYSQHGRIDLERLLLDLFQTNHFQQLSLTVHVRMLDTMQTENTHFTIDLENYERKCKRTVCSASEYEHRC